MKTDLKYLFVSTGIMLGWDGVRHLLHTVSGQALQHILLVSSLKEVTRQVTKSESKCMQSNAYTLGGDTDRVPLPKKIPSAFLSYEKL